jgi:O-acetyl-ADP-ribose deacetylase (regulator of RNase III)
MAKIVEINGNIFESSCQTIVNTVNCVGVMGKGIAFEYRNRYPEMYHAYVQICETKQLRPGLLHLWTKSCPWILNFPTKDHWKLPSKIEYVDQGLTKFRETYVDRGITSIAFPELGTSSGGLEWCQVGSLMYCHLEPLPNLAVEIYHYSPNSKDSFFDQFYQKVHRFSMNDYKHYIGLSSRQAKLLQEAIWEKRVHNMIELQQLEGIGEKSLAKIYNFVNSLKEKRIITESERQPSFDFGETEPQ